MDYKKEFIEFMVRSDVLAFGDFITKSGRNTPYFVNTGNYKTGDQLARLGNFYAECIMENIRQGRLTKNLTALYGPAYKGIPISVASAISLSVRYGMDVGYCSSRKEEKDHGEGGTILGHSIRPGDSILIVEDVITAGTAMRECVPALLRMGAVIEGLVISVDRMERGAGSRTAIQELKEDFGIPAYPLVTLRDIMESLSKREADGRNLLSAEMKRRMEVYMDTYCTE